MYKKTRKKFIFLSMISLTLILFIIVGAINISNFVSSNNRSDEVLNTLVDFDDERKEINGEGNEIGEVPPSNPDIEKRMDERFFFVTEENGNIKVNLNHITRIDETKAKEYYSKVSSSNNTRGYVDYFRYLKKDKKTIFLDCEVVLNSTNTFLKMSLIFSSVALVSFFLLIFFGSYFIFKPIKENDEKQKAFITNASHQLKTPIAIIEANNELNEIQNGETEITRNISKQTSLLNSSINKLLALTKTYEKSKEKFSKIDISKNLKECIEVFEPIYLSKDKEFITEVEDNLIVNTNESFINEIFNIVFDNAAKYCKSYVKVKMFKIKNQIKFIEENDVERIEDGNLNNLLERFARSKDVSNEIKGTGIGLSILRNFCDLTKTKINVYAKNNIFFLELVF